jgi:FkbM family methyltransferase
MSESRIDELNRLIDTAKRTAAALDGPADHILGKSGRPILLLGSGYLGRITCERLLANGVQATAFVDNDPRKWGTTVLGLPVLSREMAAEAYGNNAPMVNCVYTGAGMARALRARGVNVLPYKALAFAYPAALIPHCSLDHPGKLTDHRANILAAYALWADDASRDEYVAQVRFRATLDGPMPPFLDPSETYFPEEIVRLKPDEVFVDCGAFDGDSIRAFLRQSGGWFGGAIGIEADPENASRMRQFVNGLPLAYRKRIIVIEAAVSDKVGTVSFQATGTFGSTFVGSTQGCPIEVPCRPLDDILAGNQASYIKMDIEGAEPLAISGAAKTIRDTAPVLAICLYHDVAHLWEIPLQIRALSDRYDFFLRRYSDDVWEQVCYAIPKERILKT